MRDETDRIDTSSEASPVSAAVRRRPSIPVWGWVLIVVGIITLFGALFMLVMLLAIGTVANRASSNSGAGNVETAPAQSNPAAKPIPTFALPAETINDSPQTIVANLSDKWQKAYDALDSPAATAQGVRYLTYVYSGPNDLYQYDADRIQKGVRAFGLVMALDGPDAVKSRTPEQIQVRIRARWQSGPEFVYYWTLVWSPDNHWKVTCRSDTPC